MARVCPRTVRMLPRAPFRKRESPKITEATARFRICRVIHSTTVWKLLKKRCGSTRTRVEKTPLKKRLSSPKPTQPTD
eukprot:5264136-Prymnesium_polylepis.1